MVQGASFPAFLRIEFLVDKAKPSTKWCCSASLFLPAWSGIMLSDRVGKCSLQMIGV